MKGLNKSHFLPPKQKITLKNVFYHSDNKIIIQIMICTAEAYLKK